MVQIGISADVFQPITVQGYGVPCKEVPFEYPMLVFFAKVVSCISQTNEGRMCSGLSFLFPFSALGCFFGGGGGGVAAFRILFLHLLFTPLMAVKILLSE